MQPNVNDEITLSDITRTIKKLFSDKRGNMTNFLPALLTGFAIMLLHIGFSAREMEIGLAYDPYWIFTRSWINEAYFAIRLFLYCLAAYVFYLFYNVWVARDTDKRLENYCRAFAFFSAFIIYLAKSYYAINSWKLVFTTHVPHLLALTIGLLGLTLLNYRVGKTFLWLLRSERLRVKDFPACRHKRFLLKSFALFLIIEGLYIAAFYPGTAMYDGIFQLLMYYGYEPLTNHHPVVSTWLMGTIFDVGKYLGGSDNSGLFFYCLVQVIFQSLVFTYCLHQIARLTQNRLLTNLSLCFFAITPSLMSYGAALVKDTLYYNFCLLALVLLSKIFLDREAATSKTFAGLTVCCVCVFLTRNNGIFCVVPMLLAALAARWRDAAAKKALLRCLAAVVAAFCVLVFALNYFGIHQPKREALSIPFQQTGRLIKLGAAMDAEDREAIDELFDDFDFKSYYDPKEADPVKMNFVETSENLQRYKDLYVKYFYRYPDIYLEAFLNQNCGYFFPLSLQHSKSAYGIDQRLMEKFEQLKLQRTSTLDALADFLTLYAEYFYNAPFNNVFVNSSFYVWLFLFCAGVFCVLRSGSALAFVMLPLFTIASCLFSPVTAYVRYIIPLMAATPLLLMWCVKTLRDS